MATASPGPADVAVERSWAAPMREVAPAAAGPQGSSWVTVGMVVLAGIILIAGLALPPTAGLAAWLTTLVATVLFTLLASRSVTGRWAGLLIDEQNTMSLSRLQMVLWTFVVLSGFLTAALRNIRWGAASPLSIAIPPELWLIMGISTTSLVGSPLILSTKKDRGVDPEERSRTMRIMASRGRDLTTVTNEGQVVVNMRPEDARLRDLFRGEEVGNAAHLDLARVQLFYFTVVLVLAYSVALAALFSSRSGQVAAFPPLDSSMVALLGISHAGYLTNKAVPHTKEGSAE